VSKSIVQQKSYDFALQIVKMCAQLKDKKQFEISSQLLRSSTSIGANVEEALDGQSRRDFFAKMAIASKEAREANYWLRLIKDAELIEKKYIEKIIPVSEELIKILTSIVKTGYENMKINKNSKLTTKD
jgi:four helix bundle protein